MNIEILEVSRIEPLKDKALRAVGIGADVSHWSVVGTLDGNVKPFNLLKFNTGLKLFVEKVEGNKVFLSTIREIKEIGNLKSCEVRMQHWKYGRNG